MASGRNAIAAWGAASTTRWPDGTCVECFGHGERFVVYVDDDSDDDFEVSA